jgi:hypothetical protein
VTTLPTPATLDTEALAAEPQPVAAAGQRPDQPVLTHVANERAAGFVKRLIRPPVRFLVLWTLLCALPLPSLIGAVAAPTPASCQDMCDLDSSLAMLGIFALVAAWLAIGLLYLWIEGRASR